MEPVYVHLAIWLFPVSKPNIQIQIETPFGKWQFHGSFSKYCELWTEGTQSQCFSEWERSIQFGIEMSVITKWREKKAIPFNPSQIDGKSLLLLVCML